MTGKLEDPKLWGMMPQVVDHLFNEIKKLSTTSKTFKVRVSYIELYNGKSRDLLATKQVNLEIKQNMAKNFYVKGADMPEVTNFDECIRYFNQGTDRRQTASTDLNDQSSRSHSLFQLQVEQFDFEHDPSTPVILTSKINVVDLAGSEKLSKTNATGETAKEGCNINLSLSALATVIDTIVKGAPHIPYRGSPLTMLLKDSLGGNAKTVMFANVGPSDKNISETISTLRFALRAKQIENKPIKNLDPKDARIQELLDKIEELQKRMGNVNLNEEENLKQRIEELEIENADLRGAQHKDTIELEEINKSKQAQIEQLMVVVKERDHEIQNVNERLQLAESNLKSDADYQNELKSVACNFVRRICTEQQLELIRSKLPRDGEYNLTNDGWELKEIQFYFEGFLELYNEWRQTAFTQEDVQKHVTKATADLQDQFQRQLNEAIRANEDLMRQKSEEQVKRAAEGESQSQLRVEMNAMREENAKLREKIERDQEKMKAKLAKNKEEYKALQDELDNTKTQWSASQRDVEKLKKLLEESGSKAAAAGNVGSPVKNGEGDRALQLQLEASKSAQTALEAKLKETIVQMRRNGFSLKDTSFLPGAMTAGGDDIPPPPPGSSEHNEAFIQSNPDEEPVDGDLLGQLQQQIRIQHRLQELRQLQQRKLDDMVRKYELLKTGKVTPNSVEAPVAGGVSEELVQQRVAEAVVEKDTELANLRAELEKTTDKLVKKLNKEASKAKEMETTFAEEKAALEEERHDLLRQTEELQKFNQTLSVEVENLRTQIGLLKSDSEGNTRSKDAEIQHLKNEVTQVLATLEQFKTKASEYENLSQEFQRLQQQNQRTEAALKEKITTLDNNRQMIKWSNSLLEAEKKKVQDAEEALKRQEQQFREMEETWRAQIIENANRLVAVNNKRLEEQAAQYQQLVAEEQEKQKTLREKLKKAKAATQKAAQRYDEMVLENESLL
eukprot:CAMPEP_0176472274 /NCGR_PEP_ID=MMETSP0127-20121128/41655_1 /TAXON_ID=938130 /ORGANISM="Platyophrya macrostoma, Strain WH" /LENGTH=958 /DNA_ID=CAMNT_0017867131 /DNA_START=361 /DNA_END=3233 /DNA_ORIENTATION=-